MSQVKRNSGIPEFRPSTSWDRSERLGRRRGEARLLADAERLQRFGEALARPLGALVVERFEVDEEVEPPRVLADYVDALRQLPEKAVDRIGDDFVADPLHADRRE